MVYVDAPSELVTMPIASLSIPADHLLALEPAEQQQDAGLPEFLHRFAIPLVTHL